MHSSVGTIYYILGLSLIVCAAPDMRYFGHRCCSWLWHSIIKTSNHFPPNQISIEDKSQSVVKAAKSKKLNKKLNPLFIQPTTLENMFVASDELVLDHLMLFWCTFCVLKSSILCTVNIQPKYLTLLCFN